MNPPLTRSTTKWVYYYLSQLLSTTTETSISRQHCRDYVKAQVGSADVSLYETGSGWSAGGSRTSHCLRKSMKVMESKGLIRRDGSFVSILDKRSLAQVEPPDRKD